MTEMLFDATKIIAKIGCCYADIKTKKKKHKMPPTKKKKKNRYTCNMKRFW